MVLGLCNITNATPDKANNKPSIFAIFNFSSICTLDAIKAVNVGVKDMINVASDRKFARGKAGYEQYGAVLLNSKVVAKFTRI